MTVRHLHALLHKAFDQAEKWGLVARNVVALVSPPTAPHQEMKTLSEAQTRTFLEAVAGERFEALHVLAVSSGMRQGEILALRWSDLDLDRASAQIQRSIQFLPGDRYVFTPPKTTKSRRKVELTKTVVAALRRHRARQIAERLASAGGWADLDLVFADEAGGPTSPDRVRWAFQRVLKDAGLPRIRFHDLRHTAATLLLGCGVHPKIVSEMLGHSTIAITLDLYSHVTPTMQREAAAVLDSVLGGPR
ncbi:MAG: site-specific integrase [Chloroflexota bacterium]|nr:site-specific integrase [Chloroflexota bacterium]